MPHVFAFSMSLIFHCTLLGDTCMVQEDTEQEMAQSERNSNSNNRGGKKLN